MLLILALQSLNVPSLPCKQGGKPIAAAAPFADPTTTPGVGQPFTLTTVDPATVRLAVPVDVSRKGGLATATISVPRDGVYSVAIDRPAWIDVATGTTLETSLAHRHGPDGSGIAKIVDFRLTAGDHVLALTGIAGDHVTVRVTPAS